MQVETPPAQNPYEKPEGERRAFEWLAQAGPPPGCSQGGPAPSRGSDPHSGGAWGSSMIEGQGDGFGRKSSDLERSAQLARDGWEKARATILDGEHFQVVLDEITYPLIYGWLPLEGVLQTLRERPSHVPVCLTGMQKIQHAFNAGVPAQRGIED